MTPEELAAHEARHQPTRRGAVCRTCEGLWPCPPTRASSALREAWAEAARLRAALALQAESVENAGAAIARVRVLCDEAEADLNSKHVCGPGCYCGCIYTDKVRAALDGGEA